MTKPIIRVVCDAGPIIHLDELNCLNLLADFQEIIIPNRVFEEIERHRPSALKKSAASFTLLTGKIPAEEPLLTICRIFSLDAGETEALALVQKNPESMFLTDDASARLVAEQMGFRVHGTIGIIIRSLRRGHREPEEVVRTLSEIPLKSTLHIKPALLKEVIVYIKSEFHL